MPQSPTSAEFAKELEDLKIAYAKNLPGKITHAIEQWTTLKQQWDCEAFQTFYRSIHNLAGGAGTYGISEVSSRARDLMGVLKPLLKSETLPASQTLERVDAQLDVLQALANDLDHTSSPASLPTNESPQFADFRPSSNVTTSEIFLVDDDPDQAHYLAVALEQAGHHVTRFESLEATRIALQVLEPTAILMDMMFPEGELAGAHLIEDIQQKRQIPVPIMFISARKDLEARLEAVRAGASHYFTKPVQVDKLLHSLAEIQKPAEPSLKRILIVDDDDAVGMLVATHITREEDWEAHLVTFPENLLLEMEKIQPDLVLMDFHMPACNGLELAAVLKQHEDFNKTPIIFLSEDINFEVIISATHLGSEDYLPKAIGPDRIVQAIRARLKKLDESKPDYQNPYKWLKN